MGIAPDLSIRVLFLISTNVRPILCSKHFMPHRHGHAYYLYRFHLNSQHAEAIWWKVYQHTLIYDLKNPLQSTCTTPTCRFWYRSFHPSFQLAHVGLQEMYLEYWNLNTISWIITRDGWPVPPCPLALGRIIRQMIVLGGTQWGPFNSS